MSFLDTKIGSLTFRQRIKRDVKMYFEPLSWPVIGLKLLASHMSQGKDAYSYTYQSNTSKIEVLGRVSLIVLATSNGALANAHQNHARDLINGSHQTRPSKTLTTEKLTAISDSVFSQVARRKHV